jgi:excisionase family DNA binding protein
MSDTTGIPELVHRMRLARLETEVAEVKQSTCDLAEEARGKLERGSPLTRDEVAAYLGVSYKKVQRMEAQGKIRRLPDMGASVLYAARDVLRLASAPRKER